MKAAFFDSSGAKRAIAGRSSLAQTSPAALTAFVENMAGFWTTV
jgi:hypothetical protein